MNIKPSDPATAQGKFKADVFEKAMKLIGQIPASEGHYRAFGEPIGNAGKLPRRAASAPTISRVLGRR